MTRTVLVVAFLGATGYAVQAAAQGSVEIGGGVAFASLVNGYDDGWGDGLRARAVEVHGTVPLSPRFAVDVSTTYGQRALAAPSFPGAIVEGGTTRRTEGLCELAIHQNLISRTRSGFVPFLTYGFAGLFGTNTRTPIRASYPNGYVQVIPKYINKTNTGFHILCAGGGFEKAIASRLVLRADAQLLFPYPIPLGLRASLTATVPLGRKGP